MKSPTIWSKRSRAASSISKVALAATPALGGEFRSGIHARRQIPPALRWNQAGLARPRAHPPPETADLVPPQSPSVAGKPAPLQLPAHHQMELCPVHTNRGCEKHLP